MSKADDKFKQSLLEAIALDDEDIDNMPPHKFSLRHESKMAVFFGKAHNEFQYIRMHTGMNQSEFARHFNIPLRTVQHWEAGTRKPPEYVLGLLRYRIEQESKA